MNSMKKCVILLAAMALAAGCEKLGREGNLREEDLAPIVPIELTKAEQTVRDASNDFGLSTFRKLYTGSGDVAFSPLSLSLALAMVAEGAEGETYKQFADVIGWGEASHETVGGYYKTMVDGLVSADPSVLFTSANSFWAAKDLSRKQQYQSLLKQYFAAENYTVDFSLPATLDQINKWCSDKTDGKIPKMLEDLDPATKLMLINALLFKAPWRLTWEILKNRDFTTGNGAKTKKDYLYVKDQRMAYGDYGDFELVRAAYGNGAYTMDIILPKEGKTLAEAFSVVTAEDINYGLKTSDVTLYLPKWSMYYSTGDDLIPALKAQGLTLPFDKNQADFSGISDTGLYINLIKQDVQIDVTEKGTEFAAVTVVGMLATGANPITPPKVTVDVNRPFAYAIREATSGTILLLGTLSN